MTKPLRVALVGYGVAGRVFHAPLLAQVPDLVVTTVVTSSRGEEVERDLPGVEVVPSLEQAWDGSPDLVVLATPNATHVPLAREAVLRGVAVIVDKPLARSAAEAAPLVAAAEQAGVPLGVFHNRRWDGDFLTAQALLAAGRLGQLVLWESRFERWRPQLGPGWREQIGPAEGGGLLLDLGSHLVDQALVALGPVSSVHCLLGRCRAGAVAEDDVQLSLQHRSGARSLLVTTFLASQVGPRFRLLGTEASWVKCGLDGQEAVLRGEPQPIEDGGLLGSDEHAERLSPQPGDYAAFYGAVAAALRSGGPLPVTAAQGLAVLEVLDAARQSAESGAVVRTGPA